jgi:cadmium resistance protein CadD (predicted permease)
MTENEFLRALYEARDSLATDQQRAVFDRVYFNEMKNPIIQYGYNHFLGFFGIDKFTLGQAGTGMVKLLVGVLGILSIILGIVVLSHDDEAPLGFLLLLGFLPITVWIIVNWFTTGAETRRYNAAKLTEVVAAIRENRDLSGA